MGIETDYTCRWKSNYMYPDYNFPLSFWKLKSYKYKCKIDISIYSVINFVCTYKRLDTFLTCGNHGNHLYDCIISLKEVLWAHQTSLTPSLFIEVPVLKPGKWVYILCVLGVSILPIVYHFWVGFWNCSDSVIHCICLLFIWS
jgi:hypothetical protein